LGRKSDDHTNYSCLKGIPCSVSTSTRAPLPFSSHHPTIPPYLKPNKQHPHKHNPSPVHRPVFTPHQPHPNLFITPQPSISSQRKQTRNSHHNNKPPLPASSSTPILARKGSRYIDLSSSRLLARLYNLKIISTSLYLPHPTRKTKIKDSCSSKREKEDAVNSQPVPPNSPLELAGKEKASQQVGL
jgi:hypothetical protein